METLCNINSILERISFDYLLLLPIASLVTAFLYDFRKCKKTCIKYLITLIYIYIYVCVCVCVLNICHARIKYYPLCYPIVFQRCYHSVK